MEYFEKIIERYSNKPVKKEKVDPDGIDRTVFPYVSFTKWKLYKFEFNDDDTL